MQHSMLRWLTFYNQDNSRTWNQRFAVSVWVFMNIVIYRPLIPFFSQMLPYCIWKVFVVNPDLTMAMANIRCPLTCRHLIKSSIDASNSKPQTTSGVLNPLYKLQPGSSANARTLKIREKVNYFTWFIRLSNDF